MVLSELTIEMVIAGLGGGLVGAAIGGLPALSLAGIVIVVGEAAGVIANAFGQGNASPQVFGVEPAVLEAVGVAGSVGFGPALGPHVAFAGGVAAAAYAGRQETFDTTFRYHQAKQISIPLGTDPKRLLVGAGFGALGVVVARLSAGAELPVDSVMLAVVVSGFTHRLAFGYPLVGRVRNLDRSMFDMSPFERGERWGEPDHKTSQGTGGRHVVEVWLPDYYEWDHLAVLGAGVGLASGYIALVTGSAFLAFGISAASLAFLSLGHYSFPVTHHMALPASIAAIAMAGEFEPAVALVAAGVFGVVGALVGELAQRTLYAHGDTHLDPPAVSIVLTSLLLTLLATTGVVEPDLIPYPTL
jgi:hypothetical protein